MTGVIEYLELEDLLELGREIIPNFKVRDIGLLDSAAKRPQTIVFGDDAYPSFAEKVAALMHSLARNHALVDGNRRLSWAAGRLFCLMNARDLMMSVDDAEQIILSLSQGELDAKDLAIKIEGALVFR
jgi:death-on-curing protein